MDHHILPQFYLRGFRDPLAPQGQVWVADLPHRSVRMRAPRGLACKANYYAVPTTAGPLDQEIETLILQRLAAAAARSGRATTSSTLTSVAAWPCSSRSS